MPGNSQAGESLWILTAGRFDFITFRVNAISIIKRLAKRELHAEGRQVDGMIPGGMAC